LIVRLIHLVNHCSHGHGNAHVAIDLACRQAEQGHEVIYASAGGEYLDLLKRYGVRHEYIVQNSRNPFELAASLARLLRLCLSFQPQIIHAHMMAGAVFGCICSKVTRAPLVTTVHNSFDRHSILMRLGDRVVAVSEAERRSLQGRGFNPRDLSVVINGPNHSPRDEFIVQDARTSSIEIKAPAVVTVCGLHKRKGVGDLIVGFSQAVRTSPGWQLYVVGDGPDRQKLIELVERLGLTGQVSFLGSVSNPLEVLRQCDIFVLASYADPCCLAITEAREAGCAIIATAVGGTPELLEFGDAGKLVAAGAPEEIAGQLRELMEDQTALAQWRAKSRRGREFFRVARVCDDYRRVYDEVLANPG
jgi:glycosyltransferase involved in cell wall biosynthesis